MLHQYIPCIYHVYKRHIVVYTIDIKRTSRFQGLVALISHPHRPLTGLEDNVPDVHNEADFDIPDTPAVLERFITHMSKLAGVEYQVQGPGELRCKDRVRYCCHNKYILFIFIT